MPAILITCATNEKKNPLSLQYLLRHHLPVCLLRRHRKLDWELQLRPDSQNQGIFETGWHLWRPPSPTLLLLKTQSRLLRTVSCWVLNVAKDGDSTTSPDNMFPCLTTLAVMKCFPSFKENFPISFHAHCLLSCTWTTDDNSSSLSSQLN